MKDFEELIQRMTLRWNEMSLRTLEDEARREPTGIKFEAVRIDGGVRMMIAIVVTEPGLMSRVSVRPQEEATREQWDGALGRRFMEAFAARGLMILHRGFSGEGSSRAVALIAADPDSMAKITELFDLRE